MSIQTWLKKSAEAEEKKAMPVLSFPAASLLGCTVKELISSSDKQAEGMALVAGRTGSLASVSMMDLSVEAEAFGAEINVSDTEVPTVPKSLIHDQDEADALAVPEIGAGRTGLYIETIKKAKSLITDRPVFAGVIGPFSLAGRLLGVSEIMIGCYEEEDMVNTVMEKATAFLIRYIHAYKEAGADGVVMAEPLTGVMSPSLAEDFSCPYVKKIIEATKDENFAFIYHNCGANVPKMLDAIYDQGADAYHFGDAVNLAEVMKKTPDDVIVLGNISPVACFKEGKPEDMRRAVMEQLEELKTYRNYIPSSGCDIPPSASWDNIDAYFKAVEDFGKGKRV